MKTIVRTLRHDEVLPAELNTGFEETGISPDWCWVVERNRKIVACCLAMNGHGVCWLLRIVATKDAPNYWFVVLLRRLLRDCEKRGCKGFTTYLEQNDGETEKKLVKIAFKRKCQMVATSGLWAIGTMRIADKRSRKKG